MPAPAGGYHLRRADRTYPLHMRGPIARSIA